MKTAQADFFETGIGGVLRVKPMPTTAPATEIQTSVDLDSFTKPRATHANSREAYHGTVNLRRDRRGIILGLFQDNPAQGFTDRQVLARVYPGSGDLNMGLPRITEMIADGELVESGRAICAVTGKLVRLRPLAVTFAMLLMHIASKETTVEGAIDRIIQFTMAYALVAWAMKPNNSNEGRQDRQGER